MKARLFRLRKYLKLSGLIVLAISSFVFAMFQGGFVSWFLFYVFTPLFLFSIVMFFCPLHRFSIHRTISVSEIRAGQGVQLKLELHRPGFFPLPYLIIEDQMPPELSFLQSKKICLFPWFLQTMTVEYQLDHLPRGEHRLQAVRLQTGDLFGWIQKEVVFPLPAEVLVYPAYYEIPYRQLEQDFERGSARTSRKLQQEYSVVTGVRDYQEGDQLSWIHWKATAKRNQMMTKEFEEQKNHQLYLMLDEQPSELFEELVVFTASFAAAVLKKGIPLGYIGTALYSLPLGVRNGEPQRLKVLNQLARTKAEAEEPPDSFLLKNQLYVPTNSALILITSKLTAQMAERFFRGKQNRTATIFYIKKGKGLNAVEEKAVQAAKSLGIKVTIVDGSRSPFGRYTYV